MSGSDQYIAKYYNPSFMEIDVLQKIVEVLGYLNRFNVPKPVPCSNGSLITKVTSGVQIRFLH